MYKFLNYKTYYTAFIKLLFTVNMLNTTDIFLHKPLMYNKSGERVLDIPYTFGVTYTMQF